jgi:CRISPR-associated protein Cas5t
MICIRVGLPIGSFRRPFARDYQETEDIPPPSTCYGFLLSLVGEVNRLSHVGARVGIAHLSMPSRSRVLRKNRRLKISYEEEKRIYQEEGKDSKNSVPDWVEILTHLDLLIYLDSSKEANQPALEERVLRAIEHPVSVTRFGALCLGDNSAIINSVDVVTSFDPLWRPIAFVPSSHGITTLSVWPDYHHCREGTWVRGNLELLPGPLTEEHLVTIQPPQS